MTTPITRLFRLERDLAQRERFDTEGRSNLLASIEGEPGTLAMYATHLPEDPATCYVFEIYKDDDAYQVHAASPQFKAYAAVAAEALTGREVDQLVPELLLEKPVPLRVTEAGDVAPRCCFVQILPGALDAFRTAVFANMRASVANESGVLWLYAAHFADDPLRWVFWEGYASDEAYEAHRATEHFKTYLAATDGHLAKKELVALAADTLVSKGTLR